MDNVISTQVGYVREVSVLTFDCYGTLVDWESGILSALQPVLRLHRAEMPDEEVLTLYGELESEAQRGPYRPYREILSDVVRGFGERLGFEPSPTELQCLVDSLGGWPLFSDTVAALRTLKRSYRLAVISNIDVDLFRLTARSLGVEFDYVTTAQEARAYKPDLRPFELALERIGVPHERVLHVAQSLYHDILPAKKLGLSCVWVNRRSRRAGAGATPPRDAATLPDLVVPDLATLILRMGLE